MRTVISTEASSSDINAVNINYKYTTIGAIQVITKPSKGRNGITKMVPTGLNVEGQEMEVSSRFWDSIMSRYGFSASIFKYFDYKEVFERIATVSNRDTIRLCIESKEGSAGEKLRALAASNPAAAIVNYREGFELFKDYNADSIQYNDGIISTMHTPRVMDASPINGDIFHNKFNINTPIDGYGTPNIYLAMLRQVCSNGLVAMSPSFKTSIAFGKKDDNFRHQLIRVVEGFNSDEGYAAIRQRIASANDSPASVYEVNSLYKMISKSIFDASQVVEANTDITNIGVWENSKDVRADVMKKFLTMTGDIALMYGLTNTDALSEKRQRTLNAKCTVYDLINFATEVATHHIPAEGRKKIDGWVGTLITKEYDLEGTKKAIDKSITTDLYLAN